MVRFNVLIAVFAVAMCSSVFSAAAYAQRIYSGSTASDSQYPGGGYLDSNGRAVNAEGRPVDRYGFPNNGVSRYSGVYTYSNHAGSGLYYPGGYSGLTYSSGIGYSVGVGGYSGGYSSTSGLMGGSNAVTTIVPPRTVGINGVYNSRAVMNNATRGGVIEYNNNGKGYTYTAGSSYQTVISSGPSIFPTTTIVSPSQPPVLIQSQPLQQVSRSPSSIAAAQTMSVIPTARPGDIQLVNPRESTAALAYVLNGTTYSIKPGFSQSFADDRVWTIEFLRGGSGSFPVRYDLRAGTFLFTLDENGWDLKRYDPAPIPIPALSTTSTPPATTTPLAPPTLNPVPAPVPAPDL